MNFFDRDYYNKTVKNNNYEFCSDLKKPIPGLSLEEMSKWLCVYNLSEDIVKNIIPEETLITTGVGANKEPHIGTVSQLCRILYLQSKGYNVQIVLGDLDCYNARGTNMKQTKEIVDKYNAFIEKLGFDSTKGIIRNQFDHEEVMKTAFLISSKVTDSDFIDVKEDLYTYYQKKGIHNGIDFSLKMSILLMFADFIHNGLTNQYKHVIVLSGLDEHPYVPKADEIARRLNIDMKISGMFSKLICGFNNQPKMSKSLPNSSIWVTMSLEEIRDILLNDDIDYDNPEDSIAFQLMNSTFFYSTVELNQIYYNCLNKNEEWIADKEDFSKKLYSLCEKW
ncbi:MAG: hypothetical protein IKG42_02550 [Clostridia bacterium]|nr:hypothetical protein [Clostridia bacterium]